MCMQTCTQDANVGNSKLQKQFFKSYSYSDRVIVNKLTWQMAWMALFRIMALFCIRGKTFRKRNKASS